MRAPVIGLVVSLALGCAGASREGSPTTTLVDYADKIGPLFEANCYKCHGPQLRVPSGKLRLDSRESVLKGGRSGRPSVIPGDSDASPLFQVVTGGDGERWRRMPPRGPLLGSKEVELIRLWIDQGAPFEVNMERP